MGTFKANDMVSLSAGVANTGAGNAVNGPFAVAGAGETQKAYMGSIAFTAPDSWGWAKGATLNLGAINSDIGSASSTGAGRTWLYAGATIPTPATALKVGWALDYVEGHNGNKLNPADDSVWVAGLYANFQANDKLSFNARGEFIDGSQLPAPFNHTGEELTATVQYQLWANVLSRLELRWDRTAVNAFDNTATGAGPLHKNAFLLALNVIYQF